MTTNKEKVQLIKWFAAKTKFSAEKKIKQFLERLGIEHYIPFRTVIKGEFAGIEGELIRIKGHKRVVVRLEGAFSLATTYIPGPIWKEYNFSLNFFN